MDMVKTAQQQLREKIMEALGRAVSAGDLPQEPVPGFIIEVPANRQNGDFSSNVAMASARAFKKAPRQIAEAILSHIDLAGTYFDRCEVAGPGFMNFFLGPAFYAAVVSGVLDEGEKYGRSDYGNGKKVLVEFVSANPTGPMHIGNARGGAIGDCLAAVLEQAGYEVSREFYVNDAGNQINKFALSLEVRYLQLYRDGVEMPEDAYHGADITEHAKNFAARYGERYVDASSEVRRKALVDFALPKNIDGLEHDLAEYRIRYDNWFKESTLHADGSVQRVIDALKERGVTYEKDGALWFKASEFGNDKDIVLVRANGVPTYIVPDIAYHYNKLVTRGYDLAIDVLGADHHGYVPRMRAALTALGLDADRLHAVIMQMVRLVRGGETIKLSKRSGKAITLNTLLEEVPIDAARFFFNLREPNAHFDFDLDLAAEKTNENPVYYVQYAHARICSILKKAQENGVSLRAATAEERMRLTSAEERELIHHLARLPGEYIAAADAYDPARITRYVVEVATLFHKFYNAQRVLDDDPALTAARLDLCRAVNRVIENVLAALKITAPQQM